MNYTVVDFLVVTSLPGEAKSVGHLTISHQVLASIIRVFCVIIRHSKNKYVT